MSDLITQPETGALSGAYAHGTLDQYNTAELDQINKVQYAGQLIDEVQHTFQCEVIRLKLLLELWEEEQMRRLLLLNSSSLFATVGVCRLGMRARKPGLEVKR